MQIKLKMGYHTYWFAPDCTSQMGVLKEIIGCKLTDDAGHYVGYMRWEDIPQIGQDHIWAEALRITERDWKDYLEQIDVLNGEVRRNKRLR